MAIVDDAGRLHEELSSYQLIARLLHEDNLVLAKRFEELIKTMKLIAGFGICILAAYKFRHRIDTREVRMAIKTTDWSFFVICIIRRGMRSIS